uniref:Uncharacterized protein n=1 Tax=Physcomitrium patens TaxID=3218 RepID=A0A2K1J7Q9_PHYPA|nr:hypothetical protein PHYPA_020670 [Physcomitrium patens]
MNLEWWASTACVSDSPGRGVPTAESPSAEEVSSGISPCGCRSFQDKNISSETTADALPI